MHDTSDQPTDIISIIRATDGDNSNLELFDRLMGLVPSFDAILNELLVDPPQMLVLSKYVSILFICQGHFLSI